MSDYFDEFGDEIEDWEDEEEEEDELIPNASVAETSKAIIAEAEAQSLDIADDDDEYDADITPDDITPDGTEDDEFGDNEEDEFGDNEEEPENSDISSLDIVKPRVPVRAAGMSRVRGKVKGLSETPQNAPETPVDDIDWGEAEEEDETPCTPPPRAPRKRPQTAGFAPETEISDEGTVESDEPMYDNTGLGGLANAIVGLFTRRKK